MSGDTASAAVRFAFAQAVEAATRRGGHPECQLGFFGGEPLLEWDLLRETTADAKAAATARGIRLTLTVTTNLTLLDETKAAWLREQGFHVGLSVDGNAAMHDTLRRTAGGEPSHALCARALDFFTGPDANGEVITVLDPATIHLLGDSLGWLIGRDIRRISLNPNYGALWPPEALATWRREYERAADLYTESFRRGAPLHVNVFDGKIRTRINGGYRPCDHCGFGDDEVAVSAAGWLYPCERLVGDDSATELRIGHVAGGFDPAARARLLANRGNTVAACRTCPVHDRCAHWCGCVNHAATGFINRVPGLVCHHEKLAIEQADRAAATLFAERNPAFLSRFYGHLADPAQGWSPATGVRGPQP